MTVAETILKQMGGASRISMMIGVKQFLTEENAVSFKFKAGRKANYCRVELLSDDTYKMEIKKLSMSRKTGEFKQKVIMETSGLYWDQLKDVFERNTGLYLSIR